jgi:hypothetical protein
LVYRKVNLGLSDLGKYTRAFKKNSQIVESPFLSTTKSRLIAMAFPGTNNPVNELEVLFRTNRKFRILEITKQSANTLITMEEI